VVKSRRVKWLGSIGCMGWKRNAYQGLPGKPEAPRLCARRGRRWEVSVKIDFKKIGWVGIDHWANLT
jgi:hypothetical protein